MTTKELETWRTKLDALSNTRKKQISEGMKIHSVTLHRWATGESSPQNLQAVQQLAQHAEELKDELKEAYPDLFPTPEGLQITAEELLQFFRDKALIAKPVNVHTLTNTAFEQIVSLLDPSGEGLMLMTFLCGPPNSEGKITHLCSGEGYGTGDWRLRQTTQDYELGSDSLCGMAVSQIRPFVFPQHLKDAEKNALVVTRNAGKLKSAIAYPLQRYGQEVAGALLYASVHEDFFTLPRRNFCEQYSYIYAASLFDSQFYPPDRIKLEPMNRKDTMNV